VVEAAAARSETSPPFQEVYRVKAISLWQPWATAIACGAKRIETRGWATNYTGRIAIHAAKKWDRDLEATFWNLLHDQPEFHELMRKDHFDPRHLPLGAVIATATLECVRRTEDLRDTLSPLERALGNYEDGRCGWMLSDIVAFERPIYTRGYQQLWNWNYEGDFKR
jgi:activating signal cointegrator 1